MAFQLLHSIIFLLCLELFIPIFFSDKLSKNVSFHLLPLRVFIYFYFFVQICFHFKSLPSPIHLTLFTVFPLWQYIIEKQKEVFLLFSSFFSYFFDLFTLFFSFYSFFGTFFHFLYLFHVLDAKLHQLSRLGQLWSVALPWPVICLSK